MSCLTKEISSNSEIVFCICSLYDYNPNHLSMTLSKMIRQELVTFNVRNSECMLLLQVLVILLKDGNYN